MQLLVSEFRAKIILFWMFKYQFLLSISFDFQKINSILKFNTLNLNEIYFTKFCKYEIINMEFSGVFNSNTKFKKS